jgi:predicted phosphodiesterase
MTLLVIADDEGLLNKLPDVTADVLISCGDLPDQIILRAAQRCRCRHILAVKGNHDSSAAFETPISGLHLCTRAISRHHIRRFLRCLEIQTERELSFRATGG